MSQHSIKHKRTVLTRLLVITGILSSLGLLSLLIFHQSAPASGSSNTERVNAPAITRILPSQFQSRDTEEAQYQANSNQALMAAVKVARFGLTWHRSAPFAGSTRSGGYLGMSHDQKLNAWFGDDGITVRPTVATKEPSWTMGMQLKAYGYGNELRAAPAIIGRSAKENRVEYRRDHACLIEWYENLAAGIEQGFTLTERPDFTSKSTEKQPLRLALGISGDLRARLLDQQSEIELIDQHGTRVMNYGKLAAKDANGKALAVRMEINEEGKEVVLVVEDREALYPIVIDPLMWTEQFILRGTDGGQGELFGRSVAISGNTAVVGAPHDSYYNGTPGIAYVFVRTGRTWLQQDVLRTNDTGFQGGKFGFNVAISGNTIVVGAQFMDIQHGNGFAQAQGAAYVYVRTGTAWSLQTRLTADDRQPLQFFGRAVAISGDTIIVGPYIFVRTGAGWVQQQKLTQSDAQQSDSLASAVAISGDTAIVNGGREMIPTPPLETSGVGAVYVYVRNNGIWTEQQKITQGDRILGDMFGSTIAISGDTIIASLYNGRNRLEHPTRHAAYVFTRTGGTW